MDPSELSDLVHQSNITHNFANPLNYEKVVEAGANVPADKIEKLLQDLGEQKDTVRDPTAWLTRALRKASGGGGGHGQHHAGSHAESFQAAGGDQDADSKLRKRIGWLNGDGGGFGGAIIYDKIVEASGGLPYAEVMSVLKNLEEKKAEVKDPNAWACSALRKAGGGHRQAPMSAPMAWGPPPQAWAPPIGGGYSAPMRSASSGGDVDGKVRKRVGWLNTQGGFGNAFNCDKVVEAAAGIDTQQVMKVLKDAEEKKEQVKDPTAYVTAALRKLGGGRNGAGGGCGGGDWMGQAQPPMAWAGHTAGPEWTTDVHSEDTKLRKRIGWLNGQGGFGGAIVYDKILEAAGGLEFSEVFQKLKDLEEKKDSVKDPTAWVCTGLRRAATRGHTAVPGQPMRQMAPPPAQAAWWPAPAQGQWSGGAGGASYGGAAPMELDAETTSKLHKKIKWLNDGARFDGAVNFDKVREAAAGLDLTSTLRVLKDLEEKKDQVKDPTAWATTALRKAGGGGGKRSAPSGGGHGVIRTIGKTRH